MTINECILCRGGNNIKRKDTLFAVLRQLFCCCWSAHEIPTKLLLFQYLQLLHCICWMFFTSRSVLLQFVARDCNLDLFKILEKRLNETFSRQNCYKCFVHKFFFFSFFCTFFCLIFKLSADFFAHCFCMEQIEYICKEIHIRIYRKTPSKYVTLILSNRQMINKLNVTMIEVLNGNGNQPFVVFSQKNASKK